MLDTVPAVKHIGRMLSIAHTAGRPSYLSVAGAFLCAEAWQSGLLHRAYPSAGVWASIPLATSRGFETHRFHHQSSGTASVAPLAAPIKHPGDEPVANDHLDNIRLARLYFQLRAKPSLQMKDELHEHPLPRKANRDHCRALRRRRSTRRHAPYRNRPQDGCPASASRRPRLRRIARPLDGWDPSEPDRTRRGMVLCREEEKERAPQR